MEILIKEIFFDTYGYSRWKPMRRSPEVRLTPVSREPFFFILWDGITFVIADVAGLPFEEAHLYGKDLRLSHPYGRTCTGNEEDPFADTGLHYNRTPARTRKTQEHLHAVR